MEIGMLWFDDDGRRSLEEKIRRAAEHYLHKYGHQPTLCYVNPQTLNGGADLIAGLQVRRSRTVHVNHLWIGFEEPAERPQRATDGARKSQPERSSRRARVERR